MSEAPELKNCKLRAQQECKDRREAVKGVILKEGELDKKSPNLIKMPSPWQRRKFVVHPSRILYSNMDSFPISSKDPEYWKPKAKQIIWVHEIYLRNVVQVEEDKSCFNIVTSSRQDKPYVLRADTQDEAAKWVAAIQKACKMNTNCLTNYCEGKAVRMADGSVQTWGHAEPGGDSSAVQHQLAGGVDRLECTLSAFAALKEDGSVVTWGLGHYGGDSSSVKEQLDGGVVALYKTEKAFAARKDDESVVVWGWCSDFAAARAVADKREDPKCYYRVDCTRFETH